MKNFRSSRPTKRSSPEAVYLFQILSAVVRNVEPASPPENIDWERFYRLATRHQVANIAFDGLQRLFNQKNPKATYFKINLPNSEIASADIGKEPSNVVLETGEVRSTFPSPQLTALMAKQKKIALYSETIRQIETENVFQEFEANRVRFIPLKGFVLRELYPSPEMRTMLDVDLLVDRENLEKSGEILKRLGYRRQSEGIHHDVYSKASALTLEIHCELFPPDNVFAPFFQTIWDRAEPIPGRSFYYRMQPDDFWLYFIAHLTRHYLYGGVTIRYPLDVWIFNRTCRSRLNEEFVRERLQAMKIEAFVERLERLTRVWFEGIPSDRFVDETTDFILAYGTEESARIGVANRLVLETNVSTITRREKRRYFLRRTFPSVAALSNRYPLLKKYPVLIFYYWGKTTCKRVLSPYSWRSLLRLVFVSRRDAVELAVFGTSEEKRPRNDDSNRNDDDSVEKS